MAFMPDDSPDTSTGKGLFVIELFPNCPLLFKPQHLTAPPLVKAQVCESPAAMAVTPEVSPATGTGFELSAVVLSPS